MNLLRSFLAFGIYPLIIVFVSQQRILVMVEGDSIDGLETDSTENDKNFVHPFDMSLDTSITDISEKKVEIPHPDIYEKQELRGQLESCLADNSILNEKLHEKDKNDDKQRTENVKWFPKKINDGYFKQFVRHFLEEMSCLNEVCREPSDIVNIYLTSADVETLRKYVSGKGDTSDALYIMKNMIQHVQHTEYTSYWDKFLLVIGIDETLFKAIIAVVIVLIGCVAFEKKTSLTWKNQLLLVFVIVFVISVPWNWLQLYQEKLAERHTEMMKQQDIPDYCRSGAKWTPMEAIKQFFQRLTTIKDECKEYHKRYMIDPILEVSPIKALAKTVAVLLFAPAGELGKAVAEFHNEFLGNMPKLIWIPAFISWLLILAVVLLTLYFGCSRQANIQHVASTSQAVTHQHSRQMIEDIVQQQMRVEYYGAYQPTHQEFSSPSLPPVTLRPRGHSNLQELEAENQGRFRLSSDKVDGRERCETTETSSKVAEQSSTSHGKTQNIEKPTGQIREMVEEALAQILQKNIPEKKDDILLSTAKNATSDVVSPNISVQETYELHKEGSVEPQRCLLPSCGQDKDRLSETIPEPRESSEGNSSVVEEGGEGVKTQDVEDNLALDSSQPQDLPCYEDNEDNDDDDDDFVVLQSSSKTI